MLNKKRAHHSKTKSKENAIPNGEKYKFIARLKRRKTNSRNDNKIQAETITGEDIIFKCRKDKSLKFMKQIEDNNIELDKVKANIKKSLDYDNTNSSLIYGCLALLNKLGDKKELTNLLYNSRFCLTNSIELENKIINLNEEFPQDDKVLLFENEKELVERFFVVLDILIKANEEIQKLEKKEKLKILTYNLVKKKRNMRTFYSKKDTGDETINKINNNLFDFLNDYLPIKGFDNFIVNQPINSEDNSILFMIYIYHKLFEHLVEITSRGKKLKIIEYKLKKINELQLYWKNIYNLYLKEKKITEEIRIKLELLMFFLDSKVPKINLTDIIKGIIDKEKALTSEDVKKFINENNKKNGKELYIENQYLCLKYKEQTFKFEYRNYSKDLLLLLLSDSEDKLKKAKWDSFSLIDFYEENDKIYLKNIIKKILKSKLFFEIWKEYSEVDSIVDYYFSEELNIDYLLDNIHFIPYYENHFGMHASTTNSLLIFTSSLPISNINSSEDYINYKILELARKVIILCHEIAHYIKRALFMITNGEISRTTRDSNYQSQAIEAGKMLENVLFDLENTNKNNNKKNKISNSPNKNKNKTVISNNKIIGLEKALKILDPDFYEKSMQQFKKDFYNEKYYDKKDLNDDLKNYLKDIGFNLENFKENKKAYEVYNIDCSRDGLSSYILKYKSDDHSFLSDRDLNTFDRFEEEEEEKKKKEKKKKLYNIIINDF